MFINELLILNLFSTIFMTGIIWFVQVIHYPSFKFIQKDNFTNFSLFHSKNATYIVAFPMIVELITSILLLKWYPLSVPYFYLLTGFILVLIIWFSTFLIQVPYHGALSKQYDETLIHKLVKSNWVRTVAWSLRAIIMTIVVYSYIQ